jgi:hypothetical protein
MSIVAAFLILIGVPLLVAAGLDGIYMPRLIKAVVIASLPAAAVIMIYQPRNSLDDLGLPVIAFIVVLAWLFGFATGPLVRAILCGAIRFAKPS